MGRVMGKSPNSFLIRLLFTLSVIIAGLIGPGFAIAQDMPPILAPPAQPSPPATTNPQPITPSAEAAVPPAGPAVVTPSAPARKPTIAASAVRPTNRHAQLARHEAKSAADKKRLLASARHEHSPIRHVALRRPEPAYPQIASVPEPNFPPGTVVPPPGYYDPGYREHLVYGGPPPGPYGWGGYRGRYPY
jgi:hypothetical protein